MKNAVKGAANGARPRPGSGAQLLLGEEFGEGRGAGRRRRGFGNGRPRAANGAVNGAAKRPANGAAPAARRLTLTGQASAVVFVEQMLRQAVAFGASDAHLEKYEHCARLRYRLDGVLRRIETGAFLFNEYTSVSTRIKLLAGLDIAEHRLPQDGRFSFSCEHGAADVRVSVVPLISGERIVLRILDSGGFDSALDHLGMGGAELALFRRALRMSQGMILVTGPTGSGKTTTLYAALRELNGEPGGELGGAPGGAPGGEGINILTAEDPVERRIEGINQVEVRESIGLGFADALRAFLRQDPEVILVGEIRDLETADIAMKAGLTGHLVMSTLHTASVAGTITRLVNIGLPEYLVGAALTLVVSQRLVRAICPHCREPCPAQALPPLPPALVAAQLHRGRGCAHCHHTGHAGRCAIYEMVMMDEDLRRAVSAYSAAPAKVTQQINERRLCSLQEAGQKLLRDGVISPAEYVRVLT